MIWSRTLENIKQSATSELQKGPKSLPLSKMICFGVLPKNRCFCRRFSSHVFINCCFGWMTSGRERFMEAFFPSTGPLQAFCRSFCLPDRRSLYWFVFFLLKKKNQPSSSSLTGHLRKLHLWAWDSLDVSYFGSAEPSPPNRRNGFWEASSSLRCQLRHTPLTEKISAFT